MCMVFAEAHPARNLGELSYKALKQKKKPNNRGIIDNLISFNAQIK